MWPTLCGLKDFRSLNPADAILWVHSLGMVFVLFIQVGNIHSQDCRSGKGLRKRGHILTSRKEVAVHFFSYPFGYNFLMWPHFSSRETGICTHYYERLCTLLKITVEKEEKG